MKTSSLEEIRCKDREEVKNLTLLLRHEDVETLLTFKDAIKAVEKISELEYLNQVDMPNRLNSETKSGWFRVMPAVVDGVDDDWKLMGLKAMNLIKGQGLRYMILLLSGKTGELLAAVDAAVITQMRTGAATAVAAKFMAPKKVRKIGVIGSGFEARGQLLAVNEVLDFEEAVVFSPNQANCERYAREMSDKLGKPVVSAGSSKDAIHDAEVVILATKTSKPVIDGQYLMNGCTILSIGSTRLDLRELDDYSFLLGSKILVDHKEQVIDESADVQSALKLKYITEQDFVEMKQVVGEGKTLRTNDKEILIYKSVGTALQDLAVAKIVYETALAQNYGQHIEGFPYLKSMKK